MIPVFFQAPNVSFETFPQVGQLPQERRGKHAQEPPGRRAEGCGDGEDLHILW